MRDAANKGYWQRMARIYAPFMKSSEPLYEEICQRYKPYLNKDMNMLELACGSGQLSFRLCECVFHLEATDFSESMIAQAKNKQLTQNITFAVQDATSLPYPDASFDAVLIANALHIMPTPEKAMSEIFRVLRPNGLLLAPTFIWGTDTRQHFSVRLISLTGFHVFHKWSAQEFSEHVQLSGFEVLEREIFGGSICPLCCLAARKK